MPSPWSECYRQHFQKLFRKPFDIQVYHSSDATGRRPPRSAWSWLTSLFSATPKGDRSTGSSLKLATHDWALPGFRVYASMGLADRLVQNEEEDFGEVILFADTPAAEVPNLFVHALFFILHNDVPLGSRFAIGGIHDLAPEFAVRIRKSALYFTHAQAELVLATPQANKPDDISHAMTINKVRNGDEFGWVYQAFFITAEENEFLEDNGPDAFEELFAKAPDRLGLRRASIILGPDESGVDRSQ
jgi:hypothetical protein